MTRERRFSLMGAAALLVALPLIAQAQTTPKVFYACYGSLTGVVYRIKEPGLPTNCLHHTHVQFSWTSGTGGAALTDHGALQGLSDDDHPQYLLVDGSRALTGALSVGGNKLTNLAAASADGEAVRYEQAVKSGDAAGGDLSGSTYPNPTVAKLQGTAVSSTAPTNGQVLAFNGTAWAPATGSSSGLPCAGCVNAASIADGAVTRAKLAADAPTAFAFALVNGSCQLLAKTANVAACQRTAPGQYLLSFGGERLDTEPYVMVATVNSDRGPGVAMTAVSLDGRLLVSTFFGTEQMDANFNFVIYKVP